MNVLVIEDYEPFVKILESFLGKDTKVWVATELDAAMDILARHHMDAVLLDLTLPKSDAPKTVARIGEIRRAADGARLVIVTGALPEPPPDVSELADAVLLKGDTFHRDALLRAITGE